MSISREVNVFFTGERPGGYNMEVGTVRELSKPRVPLVTVSDRESYGSPSAYV